jgi:hypothetical protein
MANSWSVRFWQECIRFRYGRYYLTFVKSWWINDIFKCLAFIKMWESFPLLVSYIRNVIAWLKDIDMERQRLAVTKRVGKWGSVYIIGGTEADGELLPAEQADDIIARFDHEQALLGGGVYHTPAISTQFCGDSL